MYAYHSETLSTESWGEPLNSGVYNHTLLVGPKFARGDSVAQFAVWTNSTQASAACPPLLMQMFIYPSP